MSFSFSVDGSQEQVIASLGELSVRNLGHDDLGCGIRDLISAAIKSSADPAASRQRYTVFASGHSGPGSLVTMAVRVEVLPDASFPEKGTATDTLGIS